MSNHTLFRLRLYTSDDDVRMLGRNLASLIRLKTKGSKIRNRETANKEVALEKILEYHPNMDMEPLFYWDLGEPYVIDWFDRAEEVDEVGNYSIKERKSSRLRRPRGKRQRRSERGRSRGCAGGMHPSRTYRIL